MIYQYRRRGSVPKLHTAIVYSFVFYLMCAYFLVLLPLPADRTAYVAYAATPQLVPFNFVHEFLAETTFSPSDPATWLRVLRDPYIYEAFFNVLLLLPLGAYLRYYFRRRWWQAFIIGFLVTLSFETTQLTGFQHLRAPVSLVRCGRPIQNTLGAMVGILAGGSCDAHATRLGARRTRAAEAPPASRDAPSPSRSISALAAALAVGSIYLVYRSGLVAAPIGVKATAAQALEATTAQVSDALLPARLCILIALVIVFFIAGGDEGRTRLRSCTCASCARGATRIVVPLPGAIRPAVRLHLHSLGAVHPAHRSGRQLDRIRGGHVDNLRLAEHRGLHRGARRVHRGLDRLADRSRRAGSVGPRTVRDAKRHAEPHPHHDGERPCGRAREAERAFRR